MIPSAFARHVPLAVVAARHPILASVAAPDRTALQRVVAGTPWRLAPPGPYEDAVVRGEIPTREGSWHDAFNLAAFARFPAAKAALHRRVHALRGGAGAGRRTPEQDALTLLDEAALVVAGPDAALASFERARTRGDLGAMDRVVRDGALSVVCFGHALLEHLLFARPAIGAGVVPLPCVRPRPHDAAIDDALATAITGGRFDRPRFSPTLPWPDPVVEAWCDPLGSASASCHDDAAMSDELTRGPMRRRAFVLYEGTRTPHRSCGIALAEAFGRPTPAYQSLRRGGITGEGTCGAIVAGQLLLGELLGDPDPTGKVTPQLRAAMTRYLARVRDELDRGGVASTVCNDMTAPHGEFTGPARHQFCTRVVAQVAQLLDETLREHGVAIAAEPVALADGTVFDPTRDDAER